MTNQTEVNLSIDMLVGKYFHTTKTCPGGFAIAVWQGHIVGAPAPGLLLVETFEWVIGEPYGQQFVSLDDFVARNPVLYDDGDEMRFSYDHGRLSHSSHCECEEPSPPSEKAIQ